MLCRASSAAYARCRPPTAPCTSTANAHRGAHAVASPWNRARGDVRVDSLRIIAMDLPAVEIEVVCGKGTYVRSLARDLALAAGSCGHLTALRRLSVGSFSVDAAATVDAAGAGDVIPPAGFLDRIDGLELRQVTPEGARRIRDGQPANPSFMAEEPSGERFCALLSGEELLAILEPLTILEPGERGTAGDGIGCDRSHPRYRYRCVLADRPEARVAPSVSSVAPRP